MSVRIGAVLLSAALVLSAAACASSNTSGASGLSAVPATTASPTATSPATASPTTANPTIKQSATSAPTKTAPAALTCKALRYAQVGSKTVSYNGYHDSIPLGGGVWSGEDGTTVTLLKPCAIGDLNGDGIAEALGAVEATSAGTGQFYTLVVWRNVGGKPVFTALADLSDRNPVQTISIANGKATVVYLTRTDDAPMAVVNLKRTAVFKLSGHTFAVQSHTDVPYTSN
ncbi:MAG TPA: hypothetical protein VGJ28_23640 [Micromonosporaceae bacterium]